MQKSQWLIVLCFFVIYVVWGSTYLVLAFVIDEIPPFMASFFRFFIAALVLLSISLIYKQFHHIDLKKIRNSFIAGIVMLGIGSGMMTWVLQFLHSGFTALLISAMPVIVVFMMWAADKKRPSNQVFVGVLIGVIGVYLLVGQDEIVATADQWKAILALLGCMISWGIGSIFISKADMPKSIMVNTLIQFAAGATMTGLLSISTENWSAVDFLNLPSFTYYSMLYLSIFGSVIAFLSFTYLLRTVSPDKVSTSAYVNPIIALFLGWWFRDELVTNQSMVAAAIMLSGVILINFELKAIRKSMWYKLPKRRRK